MHDVEAPGAHEPGQSRYRRQVAVAPHAPHVDRRTVRADRVGHRPGAGQRDHLALVRQAREQQPELVLGAADAQAGDDVENSHRMALLVSDPGRRAASRAVAWWRAHLASRRGAVSRSPMNVRGTVYRPVGRDRPTAQPYP